MADTSYPTQWRKPSFFGSRTRQNLIYAGLAIYLVWSVFDLNVDMQRVLAGFPRALDIFVRMMPPDFSRWELLVSGMIESIQMAIAATVLGVLLSIPLGICAASNLVPRPVYMAARGFIVVGRTFHEIIIAIFFVKLFGFGAVAGLLTLAFSSMTFLGKMLSEDIENIKHGPVEAIRAAETRGAQATVIACFDDLGLGAAREVARGPVIGLCQAGVQVASTIAKRFSIVTTLPRAVPIIEDLVDAYGAARLCRRVRAVDLPVLALEADPAEAMARLKREIRLAVEQDGAEAVLLGCAGMAEMCHALQQETGVPVIDPVSAAVKLAEAMAGGGFVTAKGGAYAFPRDKALTPAPCPVALG